MTNEERVLRVLSAYDGKVWQHQVVDETGWSKSKVSRVLSEMEASETIGRRQVGRRKVVYLPEAKPAFLDSSGDDDDPGHESDAGSFSSVNGS